MTLNEEIVKQAFLVSGWGPESAEMVARTWLDPRWKGTLTRYVNKTLNENYSGKRNPPVKPKAHITGSLRKMVFERDAYRCVNCGDWLDLTVDHIHPESLGGTLDPVNLQTLCRPCNSRKGTRI